ncbi:MAG: hypothetical protein LBE98_02280 [Puniceicoccales bacterium]|nr:hypothetical protein [Puniceicoccales bacterium]
MHPIEDVRAVGIAGAVLVEVNFGEVVAAESMPKHGSQVFGERGTFSSLAKACALARKSPVVSPLMLKDGSAADEFGMVNHRMENPGHVKE